MELVRNKPAVLRTRDSISVTVDNKILGAAIYYYVLSKLITPVTEREAGLVRENIC